MKRATRALLSCVEAQHYIALTRVFGSIESVTSKCAVVLSQGVGVSNPAERMSNSCVIPLHYAALARIISKLASARHFDKFSLMCLLPVPSHDVMRQS